MCASSLEHNLALSCCLVEALISRRYDGRSPQLGPNGQHTLSASLVLDSHSRSALGL